LNFIKQILEKYQNIKFNENPSIWSRSFQVERHRQTEREIDMKADGQTDRHEEANSRFLQFYERT
jgi:hypothetical protein